MGLINHTYSYSKIKSAETRIGFTRGRVGSGPYIELVIYLNNEEYVTFRDSSVLVDALSTPEKHKKFQDNHQFTKLSNYINERAGR